MIATATARLLRNTRGRINRLRRADFKALDRTLGRDPATFPASVWKELEIPGAVMAAAIDLRVRTCAPNPAPFEAISWCPRQCRCHDLVQPARNVLSDGRDTGRRLCESLDETFLPAEGGSARQHLVEHAAETVCIAPAVEFFIAHELFGAHVSGRAGAAHSGAGHLSYAGEIDHPRDPEVGQDRMSRR